MLVVMENYPQLKSSDTVITLMSQLEGTENRISVERKRFNDTTQEYNLIVKRFPSKLVAVMFGFGEKIILTQRLALKMLQMSVSKYLKIFLAAVFFPLAVLAYISPGKPTGLVNDYAKLLQSSEVAILDQKLSDYEKQTGNEISIVIVQALNGETAQNVANNLFNEWGIGKKNKDNGILVLISLQERSFGWKSVMVWKIS